MKKILIIKHGSLGDIISATSVLKDIRDHYSNDKIIVLTSQKFYSFFLKSPFTNQLILDNRKGLLSSFFLILKIIKLKPNLIIDLQNSNRTNFYAFFFRIFTSADINGTGVFASKKYINDYSNLLSVVEGLSNQIEKLQIKTRRKPYLDWLLDSDFKINQIKNKRFFIINPGCSSNNYQKKWSAKNYAEVCHYLVSLNILPILIGTSEDRESIDHIENKVESILNLCDKSPLDVIYKISNKAIGAISNDTGPAHLISASGCKIHLILSLFSNVETVIPIGKNVSYTQKKNINDISSKEIIKKIQNIFNL